MTGFPAAPVPCESCAAPIRWARTENGKRMPLDAEPAPDGNVIALHPEPGTPPVAHVLAAGETPGEGQPRYQAHFRTCPDAATWRRGRKPPA